MGSVVLEGSVGGGLREGTEELEKRTMSRWRDVQTIVRGGRQKGIASQCVLFLHFLGQKILADWQIVGVSLLMFFAAMAGLSVGPILKARHEASSRPAILASEADQARDMPFTVKPVSKLSVSEVAVQLDSDWLQQPMRLPTDILPAPSTCLHLMRIHGKDAEVEIEGVEAPVSLLRLLTDEGLGQKHIGESAVVHTEHGIRFPTASWGGTRGDEVHRDQCLASLGEFGVPLSHRIVIGGDLFTLRDVLRDSILNFHLGQEELAWTALAYALYLPVNEWRNRYGQRYCFDDLVRELVRRRFAGASCGGTHRLFALTMLACADDEVPILSAEVRTELRAYLGHSVNLVVRTQEPDGCWSIHWNRAMEQPLQMTETSAEDTLQSRLLITGHLAEWMPYLPSTLQIPDAVRERAVWWLRDHLRKVDAKQFWGGVCPHTHAVCAVRDWSGRATLGED